MISAPVALRFRFNVSHVFSEFSFRTSPISKQISLGTFGRVLSLGSPKKTASAGQQREYHEVTGDHPCPSMLQGIDHLRDPRLNKGLAFTLEERQVLGIHGLQPARFKSQEEQLELCNISIDRYKEDLNKYLYLSDLQVRSLTTHE